MIRSPLFLALLAVLSASPALAAPQGEFRASHSPYMDYHSGHSHRSQDLDLPDGSVASCLSYVGELIVSGDQELALEGIRYSQICLDQLGFTLVPEERVVCRTECPTCTTVRGYDMLCVAERVVRRSNQVDLTQLRDTKQPVSTTFKWCRFILTFSPSQVAWHHPPPPTASSLQEKSCPPPPITIGPPSLWLKTSSSIMIASLGTTSRPFLPRPPAFLTTVLACSIALWRPGMQSRMGTLLISVIPSQLGARQTETYSWDL